MTERSNKILSAFYRSCLGKNPTFDDDKKAIAAVVREIANEFQYYNSGEGEDMIIDARDLYDLATELESSVKSKDT